MDFESENETLSKSNDKMKHFYESIQNNTNDDMVVQFDYSHFTL
jgi:hypothetical protein